MPATESSHEDIVSRIWQLVEPVIQAEGMDLLEVEFRRESIGWVLRLFIDQEDGVSVDDCARVSRVVSDLLDVADPIDRPYHLEVSSPGLDRPLRKVEHFQSQVGKIIEVRSMEPMENRRNFKGKLTDARSDAITVDCDGRLYEIPLALVERARLRYFDSIEKKQHSPTKRRHDDSSEI